MRLAALILIVTFTGACASVPAESTVAQAERQSRDLLMRVVVALGHDSEHPQHVRLVGRCLGTTGWILTERDPWNQRFWLDGDANAELIVGSNGPDRVAGTSDDIIASLPHPLPELWGPTPN